MNLMNYCAIFGYTSLVYKNNVFLPSEIICFTREFCHSKACPFNINKMPKYI